MEPTIPNELLANDKLSFDRFRDEVLNDYRMVCESREASLIGRKEVLTGKAKFGIFGDGKEVAQVAAAKFFQPGDFLSGYYRDQTISFATGAASLEEFFSQLYADPDPANDPHSGGRQMNSHFASEFVDKQGEWLDLVNRKNITAGMAPTAAQLPRSTGLALASKLFRYTAELKSLTHLSRNGNEVCYCTIGDASTSEGHFWESVNAAGVLQIPIAFFVWDDGYGISVPRKLQTIKASISEAMKGMQRREGTNGIDIYKLKGWDYAGMCEVLESAIRKIRDTHIPALFHVEELTQPQGHSTSGSHERYKTPDRLAWEREWDAIKKMREWILDNQLASDEELEEVETHAKEFALRCKQVAWERYLAPIKLQVARAIELLDELLQGQHNGHDEIQALRNSIATNREPLRKDVLSTLYAAAMAAGSSASAIMAYYEQLKQEGYNCYSVDLYQEGDKSALKVQPTSVEYDAAAPLLNGYEVLNRYFDALFASNPKVIAFGEDLGKIGDVNQGFAGLQKKYGETRIFDSGIRELTIVGQGIGLAMRGLRPIAEIQYIDYMFYGLQPLADDAATLHWRSRGRQSAPLIIRTRGHRLEGIWHSGSPMGMLLHSLRGMHLCVPRNMTQAIGMYNTLLRGNDPAIMVECLNGYRLKEKLPANLLGYCVPLGVPEIVRDGRDVTIVTYGSTLRIVLDAAETLHRSGIDCEVVDVQTLLPFDLQHVILSSLKKTNRIVFVDEDVPGGAAGYMYNKVMEEQNGYRWLDVAPRTITASNHRPSYGSDGDYFSKPNAEQIMETVRKMMQE